MKILTVTDLHQRPGLYSQLAQAVAEHKPDVVACVGDFLDGEFPRPKEPLLSSIDAALKLAALPCKVVFTPGNHEDLEWDDFELAWKATGRELHALHGTAFSFGPLTMIGFPCWLGSDTHYRRGRELRRYLPEFWLPKLLSRTGAAGRTLWLMHEPPTPELANYNAYEPTWKDAIEEFMPLLTVSGHDHSTPFRTGIWNVNIGRTVCINAGQRVYPQPGRLVYCLLEFKFASDHPALPVSFRFSRMNDAEEILPSKDTL